MKAFRHLSSASAMPNFILGILWACACTVHAAGDAQAARPGTLSVSSTVSGCTFTVDATWSGFMGGNDTLEVSLSQLFPPPFNDGIGLEPSVFVRPVKGKGGRISVTLPAIAGSATTNPFQG